MKANSFSTTAKAARAALGLTKTPDPNIALLDAAESSTLSPNIADIIAKVKNPYAEVNYKEYGNISAWDLAVRHQNIQLMNLIYQKHPNQNVKNALIVLTETKITQAFEKEENFEAIANILKYTKNTDIPQIKELRELGNDILALNQGVGQQTNIANSILDRALKNFDKFPKMLNMILETLKIKSNIPKENTVKESLLNKIINHCDALENPKEQLAMRQQIHASFPQLESEKFAEAKKLKNTGDLVEKLSSTTVFTKDKIEELKSLLAKNVSDRASKTSLYNTTGRYFAEKIRDINVNEIIEMTKLVPQEFKDNILANQNPKTTLNDFYISITLDNIFKQKDTTAENLTKFLEQNPPLTLNPINHSEANAARALNEAIKLNNPQLIEKVTDLLIKQNPINKETLHSINEERKIVLDGLAARLIKVSNTNRELRSTVNNILKEKLNQHLSLNQKTLEPLVKGAIESNNTPMLEMLAVANRDKALLDYEDFAKLKKTNPELAKKFITKSSIADYTEGANKNNDYALMSFIELNKPKLTTQSISIAAFDAIKKIDSSELISLIKTALKNEKAQDLITVVTPQLLNLKNQKLFNEVVGVILNDKSLDKREFIADISNNPNLNGDNKAKIAANSVKEILGKTNKILSSNPNRPKSLTPKYGRLAR